MTPPVIYLKVVGVSAIEIFFEHNIQGYYKVNCEGHLSKLIDPIYFKTVQFDSRRKVVFWKDGESIAINIIFEKIMSDNSHLFPHKGLLKQPPTTSLLYKIVQFDYFFDMCSKQYIYFNHVKSYKDDINDAEMPPLERITRKSTVFESNHAANLYDNLDAPIRNGTYACCFTLEESVYIGENYARDQNKDLCLIFNLERLIKYFTENYTRADFLNNKNIHATDFHINCGKVWYIDRGLKITNQGDRHKNSNEYGYYKSKAYINEREFRITLQPDLMRIMDSYPDKLMLSCNWYKLVEYGALIKIKSRGNLGKDGIDSNH